MAEFPFTLVGDGGNDVSEQLCTFVPRGHFACPATSSSAEHVANGGITARLQTSSKLKTQYTSSTFAPYSKVIGSSMYR